MLEETNHESEEKLFELDIDENEEENEDEGWGNSVLHSATSDPIYKSIISKALGAGIRADFALGVAQNSEGKSESGRFRSAMAAMTRFDQQIGHDRTNSILEKAVATGKVGGALFHEAHKLLKKENKISLGDEPTLTASLEDDIFEEENQEKELVTPYLQSNLVTWYDQDSLRRHHRSLDNSQNKKFVGRILDSEDKKPKITIEDEAIFDRLEADFPNFKEVIRFYKAQFRLLEETDKHRISPILLLGSPGIGKSVFTKKLTEALKSTMTYLDLSATTTGWLLSGMSVIWSTPKAGKIVEAMVKSPTVNPIVVLDEIEKPVNPEHDPKASLYQLLEENTAKVFIDEFVEHPIDCSGVIYIACANELEGIPEPLLTRFKVFEIKSPNRAEKTSICQRIYNEATGGSPLFNANLHEDVIDELMDKSLREAKQFIADAVGNALLEFSKIELQAMKLRGEVIQVQAKHMNLPSSQDNKKKFGF
ncbi:hypothetical protein BCEN4_740065 [Burkholderia cenocepacia]|uniref:AAA family ATPase n=1 Tax=Burkholderia cenocepacia TaxID=95486 RepID=UPI00192CBC96|nr:AAA family ATPase [Burkholderia cenocepacia]CAD9227931.1 hypothetical protein BCEN4_740065 [Burkholderia cenocepacia]